MGHSRREVGRSRPSARRNSDIDVHDASDERGLRVPSIPFLDFVRIARHYPNSSRLPIFSHAPFHNDPLYGRG